MGVFDVLVKNELGMELAAPPRPAPTVFVMINGTRTPRSAGAVKGVCLNQVANFGGAPLFVAIGIQNLLSKSEALDDPTRND